MADGEDAGVEAVEPPASHPVRRRTLRDTEHGQLAGRDDPVLPAREFGDRPIRRERARFQTTVVCDLAHVACAVGHGTRMAEKS